jgi:hypothetical protein
LLKGEISCTPLLNGGSTIPLFGKEGLGEIFIVLCDGVPSSGFHQLMLKVGC